MKSYFITGTARGIGLGLVEKALLQEDTQVFAMVRESSDLTELKKFDSSRVHIIKGELTDLDLVDAAIEKLSSLTDSIDIAILNAAYLVPDVKQLPEIAESRDAYQEYVAEMRTNMDINVNGQLYLAQKLVLLLKKGQDKKLTFISSGMSDLDLILDGDVSFSMSYSMSKAAINVLAAKLSVIWKPEGISVFSICPGFVNSSHVPEDKIDETYGLFVKHLSRVNPELKGPLSVDESSTGVIKAIDFFDIRATGRFFSHNGTNKYV